MFREEKRDAVLDVAKWHGPVNVRVFGSAAGGEATQESDVDLLVEWERGRPLLEHASLVLDLQDLPGVPVELCTERSLHSFPHE